MKSLHSLQSWGSLADLFYCVVPGWGFLYLLDVLLGIWVMVFPHLRCGTMSAIISSKAPFEKKLEIGEGLNILINLSDKKMSGYWNKTRGTKEKLMSKTQHEGILNVNIETVYGMPIVTLSSYLFFTLLDVDWFLIDFDHIKSIRNRVLVCPVLLSSIHYL